METPTATFELEDLETDRRSARRRAILWVRTVCLALLIGSAVGIGALVVGRKTADQDVAPAGTAPFEAAALTVPESSTDGELTIVIPAGMAASLAAGGPELAMPPVIRLRLGDEIVIRNEDSVPHIVLYAVVMPGTTDRRAFDEPEIEVYTAGCSPLHAVGGPGSSLTTLMIQA